MLNVEDVRISYGSSEVLHGVSLEVNEGEIACLLGRNGMGKTTLLKGIMGLIPSSEGRIVLDGREIQSLSPDAIFELGIGYVPQGRRMFSDLTVQENMRMGLRDKRQKNPPVFDRIFDLFPILEERLSQTAGTLSGGQQQMLALARALAGEPRLLIVDEPTEGIQPNLVDEIMELMTKMNKRDGLTILLVEQNMELALSIAGQFYVMQKGLIVEGGRVENIDKEKVIDKYLVV